MKQTVFLFLLLINFSNISFGQESDLEFTDSYLASLFEIFYKVDTEIAGCMSPILEERLVLDLADSTEFNNSFKKLSKYVTIRTSNDSLVKTFSWDRISGGSWHDNASYAQFRTHNGKVKHQRLDSGNEWETGEPTSVLIYKINTIKIDGKTFYLFLGYGTYGGGKHHSLARVYTIEGDKMILCKSMFEEEDYLYVGANRMNEINLDYNSDLKELSYNHYNFDDSIGFYDGNKERKTFVLKNKKFIEKNKD